MKALVTGGGGFLGRAIVERLLARGDRVRILARGDYPELRAMGVEGFRGDVGDLDAVMSACRGCGIVYHVAALAGIWGREEEYHRINVLGTENVLAGCRQHGIERLVYTSSPSVVFDGRDQEGIDESAPYPARHTAAYPRSKAMAERAVLGANGARLGTVALRPHLIWGPRDPHLVPRILERAGRLRRIGRANPLIDSTYIDNAAEAHVLAGQRLKPGAVIAGRAYFISNGEPLRVWDLIGGILRAGGLPPVERSVPAWLARAMAAVMEWSYGAFGIGSEPPLTRFLVEELRHAHWFSIRAAERDLGYRPEVSIEAGLERLQNWLNSPERCRDRK